jgi:hypothetical protein
LPGLPQAGAGLNFAHPIVGVELDFECGLRKRAKEQIERQNSKDSPGFIFL